MDFSKMYDKKKRKTKNKKNLCTESSKNWISSQFSKFFFFSKTVVSLPIYLLFQWKKKKIRKKMFFQSNEIFMKTFRWKLLFNQFIKWKWIRINPSHYESLRIKDKSYNFVAHKKDDILMKTLLNSIKNLVETCVFIQQLTWIFRWKQLIVCKNERCFF